MTTLLENAFREVSKLSETEQDSIAKVLLSSKAKEIVSFPLPRERGFAQFLSLPRSRGPGGIHKDLCLITYLRSNVSKTRNIRIKSFPLKTRRIPMGIGFVVSNNLNQVQ